VNDPRRHSAAAERNKAPILEILRRILPPRGFVLEIASGTGQHVAHFAPALPRLEWQPSEVDPDLRASIRSWTLGLENVREPLALDVHARPWPIERADAVVCCNMIHITPWDTTLALFEGARLLAAKTMFLYGPYRRDGDHTSPSNAAFDADLRARDARWGVRDMEAVADVAAVNGFVLEEVVAMPANNFSLVMRDTFVP
jgi:hypothetical protein